MKKTFAIILSIVLLVVFCLFGFASCKDEPREVSKYVSHSFTMKKGQPFRILQLTDLHFVNSPKSNADIARSYDLRDDWAMTAVTDVINEAKPDLIVVTGDSTFTVKNIELLTGTIDNYEAFEKFALFLDSFKIPWLFIFGNHDEEGSLAESSDEEGKVLGAEGAKRVLGDLLQSDELKYCLYEHGPEEINGLGNYIVNVLNPDGSVNQSLVMFDSGSYIDYREVKGVGKGYYDQRQYEYVHDDQLAWYETAIRDISRIEGSLVSSIVFQHIPFPTYKTVVDTYTATLHAMGENWHDTIKVNGTARTLQTAIGEITYHGGVYNEGIVYDEKLGYDVGEVCCSFVGTIEDNDVKRKYDGGHEFQKLLELGSTKYVFCGHDHRNTFSFTYQGIRMTYGMSIDYSANGIVPTVFKDNQKIYTELEQRGGTLITLNEGSREADIRQIPFTRDLYDEAVKAKAAAKK